MTYTDAIRSAVAPEYERLLGRSDAELAGEIADGLADEIAAGGVGGAAGLDRVRDWVARVIRPACDAASSYGIRAWEAMHDDRTVNNPDRFALVVGFLASHLAMQNLPIRELVALVFLTLGAVNVRQPGRYG